MSTIFIENLVVRGKHGVTKKERERAQEFRIDISAEVDTKAATISDDIADTANYSDFADVARAVVEGPALKLVESIADRIADRILKDKRVKKVAVTVRKPRVSAGVTLVRKR